MADKKKYLVINHSDGNDIFVIEEASLLLAALKALESVGWGLCEINDDDDDDDDDDDNDNPEDTAIIKCSICGEDINLNFETYTMTTDKEDLIYCNQCLAEKYKDEAKLRNQVKGN